MTSQFICTRQEIRQGRHFSLWAAVSVPRGMPVVISLRRGVVTNAAK
jgi:hypothetical protein